MSTHLNTGAKFAVIGSMVVLAAWSTAPVFKFQPESRLWIEGTSTVRSFSCRAGQLEGNAETVPAAAQPAIAGLDTLIRGVKATIPVAALDCGNGTMNDHMRKALKADKHSAIEYRLTSYEVIGGEGETARVRMEGRLAMAGQEKPITMEATAVLNRNGALQVRGSKQIVMSEWGVKPPSLMLGMMKVRDPVLVHFDVVLSP